MRLCKYNYVYARRAGAAMVPRGAGLFNFQHMKKRKIPQIHPTAPGLLNGLATQPIDWPIALQFEGGDLIIFASAKIYAGNNCGL